MASPEKVNHLPEQIDAPKTDAKDIVNDIKNQPKNLKDASNTAIYLETQIFSKMIAEQKSTFKTFNELDKGIKNIPENKGKLLENKDKLANFFINIFGNYEAREEKNGSYKVTNIEPEDSQKITFNLLTLPADQKSIYMSKMPTLLNNYNTLIQKADIKKDAKEKNQLEKKYQKLQAIMQSFQNPAKWVAENFKDNKILVNILKNFDKDIDDNIKNTLENTLQKEKNTIDEIRKENISEQLKTDDKYIKSIVSFALDTDPKINAGCKEYVKSKYVTTNSLVWLRPELIREVKNLSRNDTKNMYNKNDFMGLNKYVQKTSRYKDLVSEYNLSQA